MKRLFKVLNLVFTTTVVGYLIYKLTLIGWEKVWNSLPRTLWFYIILLLLYFSLPLFQTVIYRLAFETRDKKLFWALINKRVLDKDILGYSGEMYLYLWANNHTTTPKNDILKILKDNVVISSLVSTFISLILLIIFFLLVKIPFLVQWIHYHFFKILLFVFCFLLIFSLILKFRKKILFLPREKLLAISVLNGIRLLLSIGLQIIQWYVVMPQVPWINWFTLIALQIIITRIPFLPSRDLIFLGSGIEISKWIDIQPAALAAMLLASSVINKVLNLFFFITASISTRKK